MPVPAGSRRGRAALKLAKGPTHGVEGADQPGNRVRDMASRERPDLVYRAEPVGPAAGRVTLFPVGEVGDHALLAGDDERAPDGDTEAPCQADVAGATWRR